MTIDSDTAGTARSLAGRRVLVTGAGGFIGSHLVDRLLAEGATVRALVRYNSRSHWGHLETVATNDRLDIMPGDVCDPALVRTAVEGCDTVFHLAALIAIPYSYLAPHSYVQTNVMGTLNVLEAARHCGVRRVVHTSTSETYGTARRVPIDEDHPLQGQSPYAASKIGADKLAESYFLSFGVPVTTIRPFNTYGPRQSARAVIPTIITQIAGGARQLKLGAVHPTRDFNFVQDTVRGFVSVAECDAAVGRVVNVGSNFEVSIGDTARMIANLMGRDIELVSDEQRLRPAGSEVERLWADNTLVRKLTGWQPEFGELEGLRRGLAETIAWFSEPVNLRRYKAGVYNI